MIPFARRKRRNRNFRRRKNGITPGLAITAVEHQTTREEVIIRFSGAIAWNGVDQPTAFEATTDDGPKQACLDVLASGPDWIKVEFNGGVDVGAAWALAGAMAGISPPVAWPQSGIVTA